MKDKSTIYALNHQLIVILLEMYIYPIVKITETLEETHCWTASGQLYLPKPSLAHYHTWQSIRDQENLPAAFFPRDFNFPLDPIFLRKLWVWRL